jgi:hypothetical protein
MKQEDKELLIKDLCAKTPFGVKVLYENEVFTIDSISAMYEEVKLDNTGNYTISIFDIKSYLFPLSSMTEEQKKEFYNKFDINIDISKIFNGIDFCGSLSFRTISEIINWLNKNHFDYQGLIEKDLALDATGKNIY